MVVELIERSSSSKPCSFVVFFVGDQQMTLIVSTKDVILPMSGLVSLRHSAFVLPAPRDVVKLLKSFPIRLSMKHD